MHKVIDEPKLLGYREINGQQIPIYSCKTETVITNVRTGVTYASEDDCASDVADPTTDTVVEDIKRDVTVFAPRLASLGVINKTE